MEIDERPIPGAVVEALCRLVDQIDPALIVALSTDNQKLFQGYRVILKNVPMARKRLQSSLRSERHLDPLTRTMLQECGGLHAELLAVLSQAALEAGISDLAIYYGEADFLAAALLDERESVRKLAHDFIAGWDGQSADEARREHAAAEIRSTFAPFFAHTRALQGEAMPPAARPHDDRERVESEKLALALKTANADAANLGKRAAREQKELQNKVDQSQHEVDRLRTDLRAARSETRSLTVPLADVRKELAQLHASLQQRIDEGVSNAMAASLRQWLEPMRNVADAAAGARQSDVLTRAAEVLEKQRSVDRHYGNRAALTRTIEQRRQMLAEVQRARIDALNPLPELASIAADLEHEIRDLARRLGQPDEPISATEAGLVASINAAHALDALFELRQFIQEAAAYELLHQAELHRLYHAMTAKAGMLYDKAGLSGQDHCGDPKTRFFLRHAIAQGQPFTLFIDGHNVLYALEDIFGRHFVDGLPGLRARVEFANCLTRAFDKPGADVMLYFDGGDPEQQSLSDQVRIIYSGGTGEHRADEAILKHLAFCLQSGASAPLCLVTRDADFSRQARTMGVIIMHPEELAASINMAAA